MTDIKLIPISMDYLFDGMVITYDIYDHSATLLLIRSGKTVHLDQIEAIRKINGGKDIIYVSEEMHTLMMRHHQQYAEPIDAPVQDELENVTGYTASKEEVLHFLETITGSHEVLPPEELHHVSVRLSGLLETEASTVIIDLINALALVDEYLQRHCVNVSLLNGMIGKWLKLPKETVDALVLVGLLHDCGKASMPKQVLSAERGLTVAEFEVIKMHTVESYNRLGEFPEAVRQGARSHHEKINGQGYPDGMSGTEIPLFGRITAVSDIYDAMTARRSYKDSQSPFFVMSLLKKLSGKELDPALVNVFLENMPQELLKKPVVLSNGEVGIVQAFDPDDYEYPRVKVGRRTIKCSPKLYCKQMYLADKKQEI